MKAPLKSLKTITSTYNLVPQVFRILHTGGFLNTKKNYNLFKKCVFNKKKENSSRIHLSDGDGAIYLSED